MSPESSSPWGIDMRSDLALLAVAALAAATIAGACARTVPAPQISAVSPQRADSIVTRRITIDGSNFFRRIVPDAGNPSQSTQRDLSAELSGAPGVVLLVVTTDVTLTRIVALVPSNAAAGLYDVIVHADGGDARLAHGYGVLRVDRLVRSARGELRLRRAKGGGMVVGICFPLHQTATRGLPASHHPINKEKSRENRQPIAA